MMRSQETPNSALTRRTGIVLVAVLVALLVVMLISVAVVRGLVFQHRLARIEQQRVQAFWLAESAIERARTQLESAADYDGETWRVSLDKDGLATEGVTQIRVALVEGVPNQRSIHIEARWPNDPIDGVLEERTMTVSVSPSAEEP